MTGGQIITLIATAAVTAIVTTIVGIIFDRAKERRNKKDHVQEDRDAQITALCNGTQCLLRAEIIRQYEKWIDRGYCPIYARDALTKEYKSYHDLHGNGTITGLYEELMTLPEHPPHATGGENEN